MLKQKQKKYFQSFYLPAQAFLELYGCQITDVKLKYFIK